MVQRLSNVKMTVESHVVPKTPTGNSKFRLKKILEERTVRV